MGDSKPARILLQQAKDQGAPAQAALTIDQFMRAIDVAEAQMRSSVKAYVEAALGHDNNISSGPVNANVAVTGFGGVVLSANSVERSASFGKLTAGVSARHMLDSLWSLLGSASANKRVNFNKSVFNNRQIKLTGGGAYRLDRHECSGALLFEDYKRDRATNRNQRGLVGEWAFRMDDTRELGAYVQYSRLRYPGQTQRDSSRTVVGGSYAQQLQGGLLAGGGVYVGREDESAANQPQFGHNLYGSSAGAQQTIRDDLSVFAAINHERRVVARPTGSSTSTATTTRAIWPSA